MLGRWRRGLGKRRQGHRYLQIGFICVWLQIMRICEQLSGEEPFVLTDPDRAERVRAARPLHAPGLVDLAVRGLCEVDEAGAAVLEEFAKLPPGRGWRMFDLALRDGIDAIPDAPPRLRELVAELTTPPDWAEPELFDRGATLWWRISTVNAVAMLAALVSAYQYGDLVKPLVMNGRFRQMGARRFEETARWTAAAAAPGAMRRNTEGFRETVRLRILHATISRNFRASERWDEVAWGAPANLTAASLTIIAFLGAPLRGLELVGVKLTDEDHHAMAHQWSCIGSMLGVPDRLLPRSVEWAEAFLAATRPILCEPDESSMAMVAALRENVIRPSRLLPGPLARVTDDPLRRIASRALMSMSRPFIEQLIDARTADVLGVPRGPLSHWIPLARPAFKAREALRRTGLFGSDLTIAERQRRGFIRLLDQVGEAARPARPHDMPTPAQLRKSV